MSHRDTCPVEVYRPKGPNLDEYGPFQRCGRKRAPGYEECRRHLRQKVRQWEKEIQAAEKALDEGKS